MVPAYAIRNIFFEKIEKNLKPHKNMPKSYLLSGIGET